MIEFSKKNGDVVVIRENPFEQKQKNSKRKFNRELALICLRTTAWALAILRLHDGAGPVSKCIMRPFWRTNFKNSDSRNSQWKLRKRP